MPTMTSTVDRPVAEQVLQWLALALTPGLGPHACPPLGRAFRKRGGGFSRLPDRTGSDRHAGRLGAVAWDRQIARTGARGDRAKPASPALKIVTLDDPAYPPHLKQIYDPPLVLYVRGDVNVLTQPGIAVVGHAPSHTLRFGHGGAPRHRSLGAWAW